MNEIGLRDLAKQAAEGDIDAAERLMRGAHDHIFGLLYLLGVPRDDIDDVGQDVAMQIYTSLPKYDAAKPFLPWMRSIARHRVSNYWRGRTRKESHLQEFQQYVETEVLTERPIGDLLDLQLDRLSQCVERLKGKHRQMVRLRYFENCATDDIARNVGMTNSSVRTILVKIRDALRRCVETSEPRPAGQES